MTTGPAAPPAAPGREGVRLLAPPLLGGALFFAVAFSPVTLLGCAGRGLAALCIALACGAAGVHSAVRGARHRLAGDPSGATWVFRSLLFAVPVAAMAALA